MTSKRDGLAGRRAALGYSQEGLADRLGIATSTVVRWENNRATPQPHQRPKIAMLLKVTASELDALLTSQPTATTDPALSESHLDTGDVDDMKRRDVLGLLAITGALITLPRAEAAAGTSSTQPPAGPAEAMNSHLWLLFALSASKQSVYPLVRHQLGVLAKELGDARTEGERRQLCALTGDLYQLAGEIFFDGNRYTDAAHCYALAASAAKEAENFDLWACAMTRHAFIELYERRFTVAAPILSAASRIAQRGDGALSTRYWVAAVQAEAYAGLGDLAACDRALDTAEQVHSLGGRIHNGGWLRFDGSRLAEERGTCYLELGRPDLAQQSLTAALSQKLSLRRRGAVLAELAALGAQQRDVDQVLHYSRAAIELAGQTGSGFIGKKLQGLQLRLAPLMADGRVSDLHHQISALSRAA
ncbi:helix-turn-helix transcriptional regulator [Kitasatospora sp. NPDC101801]|uniref:helix-turn-helix transcriptional regulator n=1 Tax=Kitasatospora sp. NPDC101801 TaxID=3364103 RepID=UPI003803EDB6